MKWEYKKITINTGFISERDLEKLGGDEWELVSVCWAPQQSGSKYFFKRPKKY